MSVDKNVIYIHKKLRILATENKLKVRNIQFICQNFTYQNPLKNQDILF